MSGIVTLDEVRAEINTTSTADDSELQGFIEAVTAVIEEIVGPVTSQTFDEFHDGGTETIVLRHAPVLSVQSVTEWSPASQTLTAQPFGTTTYTAYGYRLDTDTGCLYRVSGGLPYRFYCGHRNIEVAYTAGRTDVPANVRLGALELIRMQWKPQQSGNLPGVTTDEFGGINVMGFFVPNRVMELLGPSQRAPRVA